MSAIQTKSRRELEKMREASRHVGEILVELKAFAAPGVTTGQVDELARKRIRERKVESSFLGYGPHGLPGYPGVICLSVNEEIVHGIPGPRELKEGDILGLDFGVSVDGWHGDSAVTVPIGPRESCSPTARRLLDATRESLYAGIGQMRSATGSRTSVTPCRSGPSGMVSPWSASSWATGSGASCTRRPRFRTSASRGEAPGSCRAWCSRSSRW